jgi:CBS domain-containing protein
VLVVLERMKSHRVKRVVVCDAAGQPVGMVTRSDFVKLFFDRHWGQTGPGNERRPGTKTSAT